MIYPKHPIRSLLTSMLRKGNFSKSKMYCLCTRCIIVNSVQVRSEFGKFAYTAICMRKCTLIPVNPPPFRGSLPRKSLISRMDWVSCAGDINLPRTPFPPARYPPNKKSKYNKIFTYILWSIFLEIPHLELPRWWKCREIRMVKVFKWYPVIDLFDTFTGKLGHGD